MECFWSLGRVRAPRFSCWKIRVGGSWSARFHKSEQWRRSRQSAVNSIAPPRGALDSDAGEWNSAPLRASYVRCGAIGTVHIESAGATEKTCARFAIPGSSLNTLETPDSFAGGATEALRVGFQPAKKMATALERARRRAFASVTELRLAKVKRSSSRTCCDGGVGSPMPCRSNAILIAARVSQFLRERIGDSED